MKVLPSEDHVIGKSGKRERVCGGEGNPMSGEFKDFMEICI
jgi:hypothetical protein